MQHPPAAPGQPPAPEQSALPVPPGSFVFYERAHPFWWMASAFVTGLFIWALAVTPAKPDNAPFWIGFFALAFCLVTLAWPCLRAYFFPLFTLSPQGLFCHSLKKEISWDAVAAWKVRTIVESPYRGVTAFELELALKGGKHGLLPCKRSRVRVESKCGYETAVRHAPYKRSRVRVERTKIVFSFSRFPRSVDKDGLKMLLAAYAARYGTSASPGA